MDLPLTHEHIGNLIGQSTVHILIFLKKGLKY